MTKVGEGEPARRRCDGILFHDFISGHRHSGAAQRNPESSALVLVQLSDSVRSRSDRIGYISFHQPTLWIPGSAPRPRNDEHGANQMHPFLGADALHAQS
jgi:hypothetical protein